MAVSFHLNCIKGAREMCMNYEDLIERRVDFLKIIKALIHNYFFIS